MAVYRHSNFSQNPHPRPSHSIPMDEKNSDWIIKNIQYGYGQYIAGQTGITIQDVDKIQLLRSYAEGKQPTEQYKKRWLNTLKGKRVNEYNYIDFENFYSPMPKYIDKFLGMFISQDHNTVATCTSEFAREYKTTVKAKKQAELKLRNLRTQLDLLIGINPDEDPLLNPAHGFAVRNVEELEIIMSSGSQKIIYELGAEKIIDHTKKLSNFKHLKREAVRDLACGFIALRENLDNQKAQWENVDITDIIIDYCSDNTFKNARYCGIQEYWTIGDLRLKGYKEEDLKKFANTYHEFNMGRFGGDNEKRIFKFYDVYYSATNSWGYDDYIIPVIYMEFKSEDVEYRKAVKTIAGDTRYYKSDYGKLTKNVVTMSESKIYKGRWIVNSDSVFDDGVMSYMGRDSLGMVEFSIHVASLKGKSMVERAKQILDEFAMWGYKMQHALAKAHGKRYTFDFSQLEEISKNTGGKISPYDLMDMWQQGADMATRSTPLDDVINYSRPRPVEEYAGGIGIFLNELLLLKESLIKDLSDVTGISPFEVPNSNTAVGIAQLAVANMGDVLKPSYDLYLEVKEKLSYNTVYRVQLLLYNEESARTYYKNIIGESLVNKFVDMNKTEPIELGISFEALPTEEMKNHVIAWADRATQGGKNGVPILTGSEYLYIISHINTHYGIREAIMMLKYREQQDEIKANQRQLQAIQAQGQVNEEAIAAKLKGDSMLEQVKGSEKQKQIQLDRDLEARNKGELQANEMGVGMFNKGFDAGMQPQNETQQQTV